MSGAGQYLKEKNSDIYTIGIDTYGSVFKKYKETGYFDEKEVFPYLTEGIGEDILPANVNFDMVDTFVKVTDKDAAIMARRLAREEGLFVGWSSGSAVYGALKYARKHLKEGDTMVIILPDHGSRYLGKVYNDSWMKDHGYLESMEFATAFDILKHKNGDDELVTISKDTKIIEAITLLNKKNISQIPVVDGDQFVGSLTDSKVLHYLIENPQAKNNPVSEIMSKPFQFVSINDTLDVLSSLMNNKENKALLVRDQFNQVHIITQHDLLMTMNS